MQNRNVLEEKKKIIENFQELSATFNDIAKEHPFTTKELMAFRKLESLVLRMRDNRNEDLASLIKSFEEQGRKLISILDENIHAAEKASSKKESDTFFLDYLVQRRQSIVGKKQAEKELSEKDCKSRNQFRS